MGGNILGRTPPSHARAIEKKGKGGTKKKTSMK